MIKTAPYPGRFYHSLSNLLQILIVKLNLSLSNPSGTAHKVGQGQPFLMTAFQDVLDDVV